MAEGRLPMWLPTSSTLQQLEHADSIEEIRERLAQGTLGPVEVGLLSPEVTRIVMPAGGGVAGQPVCAYLVVTSGSCSSIRATRPGRRSIARSRLPPTAAAPSTPWPSPTSIPTMPAAPRPSPTGLASRSSRVRGRASLAPCRPGAGRPGPVPAGDVDLRAVHAPGPRPDHLAFLGDGGAFVLTGDLDGTRGARSILGPPDNTAWTASQERLAELAPNAVRLAGHPTTTEAV